MEEVYRQLRNSKFTEQAIQNKVVVRFLLHQFWERQNYRAIQGTAKETLDGQAHRTIDWQKYLMGRLFHLLLVRSTIVKGSLGLNISA